MTRRLPIPLEPGDRESPLDYMSRLAFRNGRDGVRAACSDFGIRCAALAAGDRAAVAAVAALGGTDAAALHRNAFKPMPGRRIRHGDAELLAAMVSRARVRLCPACVRADVAAGIGRHDARSWRRGEWLLRDIHTCPVHAVALVDLGSQPDPKIPDYSRALRSAGGADALAHRTIPTEPSALELYLLARFGALRQAHRRSPFLDRLPLHACIRLAEVVGAVAKDGPSARMTGVEPMALRERQRQGFDIVRDGEISIRSFLDELLRARRRGSGDAGPQAVFGRLYLWLAHPSLEPSLLPIRRIVGEFCFDRFAIGPDDAIKPFGQRLGRRRIHSIRSASVEFGVHPISLRKALAEKGVLSADRDDMSDDLTTFDAARHSGLLADIAGTLDMGRAAERLGVSPSVLQTLVDDGLVVPFLGGSGSALHHYGFRGVDLDAFVEGLCPSGAAAPIGAASLHPITVAARSACCSVTEVLGLLRNRRLSRVCRRTDETGIPSILVDVEEIRDVRAQRHSDLAHPAEVRELMGLPLHTVRALVRLGTLPGARVVNPATGVRRLMMQRAGLERFRAEHVTLVETARERNVTPRLLWNRLSEVGIAPAVDHRLVGAVVYRRSDLRNLEELDLVAWPAGVRRPRMQSAD